MWSLPLIQAVCALVAVATTSVEGISGPAHFFEYGVEAGDTAMVRTSNQGINIPFPSAFKYQGLTSTLYKVSTLYFIICCIDTITAYFKCFIYNLLSIERVMKFTAT